MKEQLKEEFIKINPRHCLPTLDDDGFILTESRAIAIYLVEKYFPDGHPLYPKDMKQRARINQMLQFDCCTLYPRIRMIQVKYLSTPSKLFMSFWICVQLLCFSIQQSFRKLLPFRMSIVKIFSRHLNCSIHSWMAIIMWLEVKSQH